MLRNMVFLLFYLYCGVALALEPRVSLPNVSALGKPVVEKISLIRDEGEHAIMPVTVAYTIKNRKVVVISAIYPRGVRFDRIRREINRRYKKFEQPVAAPIENRWRYWHLSDTTEIQLQVTMSDFVEVVFMTSRESE